MVFLYSNNLLFFIQDSSFRILAPSTGPNWAGSTDAGDRIESPKRFVLNKNKATGNLKKRKLRIYTARIASSVSLKS
jgi:hypothetical protein